MQIKLVPFVILTLFGLGIAQPCLERGKKGYIRVKIKLRADSGCQGRQLKAALTGLEGLKKVSKVYRKSKYIYIKLKFYPETVIKPCQIIERLAKLKVCVLKIYITARGRVSSKRGKLYLKVARSNQVFRLKAKKKLLKELCWYLKHKTKRFKITGYIKRKKGKLQLFIRSFRPIKR
jgi:hypothetical protein